MKTFDPYNPYGEQNTFATPNAEVIAENNRWRKQEAVFHLARDIFIHEPQRGEVAGDLSARCALADAETFLETAKEHFEKGE